MIRQKYPRIEVTFVDSKGAEQRASDEQERGTEAVLVDALEMTGEDEAPRHVLSMITTAPLRRQPATSRPRTIGQWSCRATPPRRFLSGIIQIR